MHAKIFLTARFYATGFFQNLDGPSVGHRLGDYMVPFFPLVRNRKGFTPSDNLGYVYDYLDEPGTASS